MDVNKELPREQVEEIVTEAKYRASGDIHYISFDWQKEKNRRFMTDNNLDTFDVKNCLLRLRVEDYSHTSFETGKKEAHVFSASIWGLDIYLKFQLRDNVLFIKVLSFHDPKLGDLNHPYRPKKGGH